MNALKVRTVHVVVIIALAGLLFASQRAAAQCGTCMSQQCSQNMWFLGSPVCAFSIDCMYCSIWCFSGDCTCQDWWCGDGALPPPIDVRVGSKKPRQPRPEPLCLVGTDATIRTKKVVRAIEVSHIPTRSAG